MPFISQSPLSPSGMTHSSNILGRLTSENLKASVSRIPNVLRLWFRCFQAFFSLGAFLFGLSVNTRAHDIEIPFRNSPSITFLYISSATSFCTSIFFIIDYYRRRMQYRVKIKRIYLIGLDFTIFIFWLSVLIDLFLNIKCWVGTLDGWCDLFNTSLFFSIVSMILCFICLCWDIVGTWFQD